MTCRHATNLSFLVLAFVLALPNGAQAKLTSCTENVSPDTIQKENWIRLQLPIPNVTVTCTDDADTPEQKSDDVQRGYVKDMGQYIGGLYKYFVGAIGIMAALMVFYGGLRWLSAGGNASRVKEAKEVIFAALIAILIAFGSYTLLYTINPKLVVLNPPVLKVADTFLVSFDNTCTMQKVCLSGTNAGNNCTDDASCPGTSTGGCGLPLELEGEVNPVCGARYKYKKIPGLRTPSETCLGTFCAPDASGSPLACRNSDDPGKVPEEGKAKCMAAAASCDRTTDTTQCASLDQPGSGICRGIGKERCGWYPRLVCPATGEEVGCGECNTRLPKNPQIDCAVTAPTTPKYQGGAYQPEGALKPAICCVYRYNNTYYYKY